METQQATFGLMGKHPGYGDFLRWGLRDDTVEALTQWCDTVLPPLRDDMADDWGAFWDHAQDLRFWIGRAVLGRTICGVLRPSRDKVGRRYPLLILSEGIAVAAPLASPDQSLWEALEAHLERMRAGQGAMALMEGLSLNLEQEDETLASVGPTLWAHQPNGDLGALLEKAAEVDPYRAQLGRSYWWAAGDETRAPVWLGCQGLPHSASVGWLLGGVAAEALA
jgi:type VI secretion system protein ImpM